MYAQRFDKFAAVEAAPLALTVVIPTLNERGNVEELLSRLSLALAGIEWEAIVVDDGSDDGTPERVAEIAQRDRRVRLVHRFGRRGLSSAVVEGMLASTAPMLAVIDADLQHDETILPAMVRAVEGGCDLAIGTRYAGGGSVGSWSASRTRISRFSTRLAGMLLKTELSDPMSGFFVVRRDVMRAALPRLSNRGYKILLDLVASSPRPLKVHEEPFTFRNRVAGASKLDSAVAIDFVELLIDKAVGRFVPLRFLMFAAVGGFGLFVHLALLGLFLNGLGAGFAAAQTIAVVGSMTLNFFLNNSLTYRDRRLRGMRAIVGLLSFYLVCSVGAAANVGVGTFLYTGADNWWIAGAAGAVIGSVWNYAATSWFTWARR